MNYLYLHVKTSDKGFQNLGPCIILTYGTEDDFGVIQRSLKTRNVEYPFIARRAVSQNEFKTEGNASRVEFIRYTNWDKLINDELKFTSDENWLNELAVLQQKFRQFSNK